MFYPQISSVFSVFSVIADTSHQRSIFRFRILFVQLPSLRLGQPLPGVDVRLHVVRVPLLRGEHRGLPDVETETALHPHLLEGSGLRR